MLLITNKTNLRYLINFTGSNGVLFMGRNKNYFFTDFRYLEQAQKLAKSETRIKFETVEFNQENLKKIISKEIQYEENEMTVARLKFWKKQMPSRKWIGTQGVIEKKRAIKSEKEVSYLKRSQKINEETLSRIKNLFKIGVSELELAWEIKTIGHELGAEDISFEPIVAFGKNSAVPHHQNTNKKLTKNEIILIDMGMKYKGYCSDMTRTFFFGKASNEQMNIYQTVLKAQKAAIKAISAKKKAASIDKIARKEMGELSKHFGHSLGHGIGLDVHEMPNLSSKSTDTLKENMIVTVEPGIYLPGKFGVRIEDMGRVTKNGYENFTHFPHLL